MRRGIKWLAGSLVVLSVLAFSCAPADTGDKGLAEHEVGERHGVGEMVEGREIQVTPDGVKYLVEPEKIIGGGPPKDGIPSIDDPRFVSLEEADQWIQDNELVIAITHKGEVRVYPLQIMVWHEIVNEVIGGDPLLITY